MYGWLGCAEHLRRESLLDDLAVLHHHDPVGAVGRDRQVVRDEQDAPSRCAAVSVVEEVEDPALHGDVERAGRLVGDHQGRLERERDADQHALPHAAGQLVRVLPGARLGVAQPDRPQDLDGLLRGGRPAHPAVDAQHLRHLVADPGHRVERDARVLRHQPDPRAAHLLPAPSAGSPTSSPSCSRTLPPTTRPPPGEQADHRVRGRRLAGAGLADQRDDLAGVHVEADAAHGLDALARDPRTRPRRSRTCRTGCCRGAHRCALPSRRRPSRLAARTRAAMTRPGRVVNHQATER